MKSTPNPASDRDASSVVSFGMDGLEAGGGRWCKGVILVPIDFSDASWRALALAASLAKRNQAKLILLHVVDANLNFPPTGPVNVEKLRGALSQEAAGKLALAARAFCPDYASVDCVVAEGCPSEEIAKVSRSNGVSLIVMGKKSGSKWLRLFRRYTGEAIMNCASCPVLTVGEMQSTCDTAQCRSSFS